MKFIQVCYLLQILISLLFSHPIHSQTSDKVYKVKGKVDREISIDTLYVKRLLEQVNESNEVGFDSTTAILLRVLNLAEQLNFHNGKLSALEKLGDYYYQQGLASQSSNYYMRGLAVAEAQSNVKYQEVFTKKIGDSYLENDFAKSILFYKKNLQLNKLHNNKEKYLLALNDIGIANLTHNKMDTALSYFKRCINENNVLKSVKINSAVTTNIGVLYSRQDKHKLALNQFTKALPIAKLDGYGDTVPFIKDQMAMVYLKLNENNRALGLAREALSELPDRYDQLKTSIYNTISDAYLKVGDDKNALANYKLFATRKLKEDSLKNNQIANLLNLIFENEEQLQLLNKLNLEIEERKYRNSLVTFAAIALLVIALLTAYFYKVQQDKSGLIKKQNIAIQKLNSNLEQKVAERTLNLEKANEELKNKNAEIVKALVEGQTLERRRVGVELHDNLGSTLSAIKWQLEAIGVNSLNDREKKIYARSLEMMKDAYSEVRLISHNLMPQAFEKFGLMGALSKLIDDINYSGKIVFILKNENLKCQLTLPAEIELYAVCLELITNILKHSNAKNASLEFKNDEGWIYLIITDDGTGFDASVSLHGNGLKHIKNRVKSLDGKLAISRVRTCTRFVIKIKNLVNTVE